MVGSCERGLSTPQLCPLCNLELTPDQLRSHLSRHMRQLALFTLPRLEKAEDSEGEGALSMGVRSRESRGEEDEEVSELEFDSNPSQGSNSEEGGGRTGMGEIVRGLDLQSGTGSEVHTTVLDEMMSGASNHDTNVNLAESLMEFQSADQFLVRYQKALELGYKYQGENGTSSPRADTIYEEALELCRLKSLELINSKKWMDAAILVVRAARISESYFREGGGHMKEMRDLMLSVGSKFVCNSPTASADTIGDTPPGAISLEIYLRPSAPSKLITAVHSQDANEVQRLLQTAVNDNSIDWSLDKTRALDYAAQRGNGEILVLLHLYGALSSRAPLWWAVDGTRNKGKNENECVEVLKLLLDFGHDPNRLEPEEGESPLHLAAKLNLIKAMGMLLEKIGPPSTRRLASIDLKDQHGLSPLYYAAKEGHGAMARLLANHGANVQGGTAPGQKSLMHYAAIHGDRVLLKILHANGSNVEGFDSEGKSPLYYASMGGSKELLETLLGVGADINRKCPESQGGRTTLHWMALEGNAAAIRILLEKGASLDECDEAGKTALHDAVKAGQKAAVYVLLEKGAAFDKKDTASKTPLTYALEQPDWGVAKDIIWMLDRGSDMKLDEQKLTALHRAVSQTPADELAIEILLRCGADRAAINIQDGGLWTPLHHAAYKGHERVVQMILDKDAEVNAKDNAEWTPLHQAARQGHERVVQILLEKGAEVNAKDNVGWAPLHQAARQCHERVVQILLEKGAEVNAKNKEEWTPLHWAVYSGHVEITRALLQKSADIEARTTYRYTSLHVAVLSQQPQVTQLLVENGADLRAIDAAGNMPEFYTTQPFDTIEINPEVAEVFRALRNRNAQGTTTEYEGERAPGAVTGSGIGITEAKQAGDVDIGPLVAPKLVPASETIVDRNDIQR